jgi:transcriptional regulator with XRE-family HTH domain
MSTLQTSPIVAGRDRGFAVRLKELRARTKLSQVGLARAGGLSVGAVHAYEMGRREPGYRALLRLAAGLGVNLDAFAPPTRQRKKRG